MIDGAPDLSFVVVTWNARDYLRQCLHSLAPGAGAMSFEAVVVDNASNDGTIGMLRAEFPWVRRFESAENLGLGAGNAVGLGMALGQHVVFCNPDVVFEPEAAMRMVAFLRAREEVGLVGPSVVSPDGSPHVSAISRPGFTRGVGLLSRWFSSRRGHPGGGSGSAAPFRCFSVHGCCQAFSKSALDAIGGFPTATYLYGEELLVGTLLARRRLQVWLVPSAHVVHHGGRSVVQRWDAVERNLVRRVGIMTAIEATRSRPYYLTWGAVKLAQAWLRRLAAGPRAGPPGAVAAALVRLHARALLGRDPEVDVKHLDGLKGDVRPPGD